MEASAATEHRLSPQKAESLWRAWTVGRDVAARDRLVFAYSPMVHYLASRKARELPTHCDLDDLVSCGLLGLLEAVDRFDPAKGATFEQYAWTRVSGAIVDELRRQDWASRSTRREGRRIERARDALSARLGAAPSDSQLADELRIPVDELRESLHDVRRAELVSLNSPVRGGLDGQPVEVGDTLEAPSGGHDPQRMTLSAERAAIVRETISSLSERERRVLALVHVQELGGAEVGALLGVSESRVSQILAGIRRKLREAVDAYDGVAAVA